MLSCRRKVTFEEGLKFAKEHNVAFLETSAKTGSNVEEIFTALTESILLKIEDGAIETRSHPGLKIGNEKYLGIRDKYGGQIDKEEKLIIGRNSSKKKGCCK